jgi:hypothetical protein
MHLADVGSVRPHVLWDEVCEYHFKNMSAGIRSIEYQLTCKRPLEYPQDLLVPVHWPVQTVDIPTLGVA